VAFYKESAAGAVVRMPAQAPAPVAAGAAKTLEEAEQAYGLRQLEKAKQLFLKTLETTDKRSVQASAYYGLARIALLEKDLDAAEQLFQKSLDSQPEAFDKAWVLVYLGRLAVAADDRDKAAEYFQSALQLQGATDKARQEAKQGLELARKKQ
jgi:tetratricopeptide (TPR) repeat protein